MSEIPIELSGAMLGTMVRSSANENNDGRTININISRPTEQLELYPPVETSLAEEESQYPTGLKFYMILLSIGLVLIVTGMDTSSTFKKQSTLRRSLPGRIAVLD